MKLYVVRHGETYANAEKIYNGIVDDNLNENGINQAKRLIYDVKKLDIDLIICSPMKRTVQTCEIINANNIDVVYDERIIERNPGILSGKKLTEYDREEFWNYYSKDNVPGLETVKDIFERISNFLEDIKIKYKNKNILLVTHSGVSRAIYFYFNEMPKDGLLLNVSGQNNCEIKMYEFNDK